MLRRVASWPTIIAAVVAGYAGSVMFAACLLTSSAAGDFISCDWGAIATAVLLLVMSYLLAKRHPWVRKVLLVVVVISGARLVFRDGLSALGPLSLSDVPLDREHAIYLQWRMSHLSSFVFHLSVVVFSVLFLCHPDVVASFGGGASTSKV